MDINELKSEDPIAWCPGCGNFGILLALKNALVKLNRPIKDVLLVSGIGQAAKLPHYIRCNTFNGLHGRALPVAAAAKMVNNNLTVLVTTGDGDCYGEGGNHLIHNIRRNIDITVIVHDNQIYGLTKGQASPTTDPGYLTKIQPQGVVLEPFASLEFAIALGCGFAARGFSGEPGHLAGLIAEAVKHQGFSLVDVLQPCVTFNKKNTYEWYSKRVYKLDNSYDPGDKAAALKKAAEWGEKIPLGIIYKEEKLSFSQKSGLDQSLPLGEKTIRDIDISPILQEFI
jgi:2-oxoglutarate/2-oxoacid ferredoxin oxidoreductase subunit beta